LGFGENRAAGAGLYFYFSIVEAGWLFITSGHFFPHPAASGKLADKAVALPIGGSYKWRTFTAFAELELGMYRRSNLDRTPDPAGWSLPRGSCQPKDREPVPA
jgi:hypothetical protein